MGPQYIELVTLQKFPNIMISCMVENTVFWLNALPVNSGISCTISPQTLMTGTTIDFKKHRKLNLAHLPRHMKKPFHATPRNLTQNLLSALDQHETSKVPIGSSTSVQDTASNKITFTPLPVPTRVINRVHALANADN